MGRFSSHVRPHFGFNSCEDGHSRIRMVKESSHSECFQKGEIITTDQTSSEKIRRMLSWGIRLVPYFPYVDGHKTQLKTTDQLSPERTELVPPPLSQRPIPSTLVAQGSYHAQCCHSITRGA